MPTVDPRIRAIVPAAGASRRMGTVKQTLRYGGSTLSCAVVRTLLDAGVDAVVVVTRSALVGALELPVDARVWVALNDDAESEMIDSVRIGLAELPRLDGGPPCDDDGVLVVPADMPTLTAGACRRTIEAFAQSPRRIVIATHAGRGGHPMIFPWSMRVNVDRLDGGLNELRRCQPDCVCGVEVDDPGVTHDIDTPDDYDRLDRGANDVQIQ